MVKHSTSHSTPTKSTSTGSFIASTMLARHSTESSESHGDNQTHGNSNTVEEL